MAPHVKSKRIEARQKYKVAKKVRAHHRKQRRQERKHGKKEKDPGIPNSWPFKQELMEQLEKKKMEDEQKRKEERERRKREKKQTMKSVEQLAQDAQRREMEFADGEEDSADVRAAIDSGLLNEGSRKAFMREFRKVVAASDVILEVLDARDPVGCRCNEAERMIMASGGTKRIVLVLNKVDLVPKEVTQKWLTYLRNDFPTVAFKAAVNHGSNPSQAAVSAVNANDMNLSTALGAGTLLQLLKNYTRNQNIKTACTVGIIGYPNVGKSSLINSLKRCRAVTVGSTPGVTRSIQEVHLDKQVRLIDSPGIVFATGNSNALVLRNCIKIENLEDPITPVEVILRRCGDEAIMAAYAIPKFKDVTECLAMIAKKRGKVRKAGAFDVESAARIVLQDWNSGKIAFYTLPPTGPKSARLGAQVVSQWGQEFDLEAVQQKQSEELSGKDDPQEMATYAFAAGEEPPEMDDDDAFKETEQDSYNKEDAMVVDDDAEGAADEADDGETPIYTVTASKAKRKQRARETSDSYVPKPNPQNNKDKKRVPKQREHLTRKYRSGAAMAVDRTAKEDTYDFSVLDEEMAE